MLSRPEIEAELERLRDAVNAGNNPHADGAYHALSWALRETPVSPFDEFAAQATA